MKKSGCQANPDRLSNLPTRGDHQKHSPELWIANLIWTCWCRFSV